ncbi:MAG: hypothetical protein AB7I59_01180 [Geminicoccaceae bacterium]
MSRAARQLPATPKVGIVSLGCPKALVDSERILTRPRVEGYEISGSYDGADVVLVNTCGSLDSAKAESLDETDFQLLLDWLEEAELDRVGCFRYENVAGAAADDLADHMPEAVKEERWHRFMAIQQEIGARKLQRRVRTSLEVLIDDVDEEGAHGRSYADAPEIDGTVHLTEAEGLSPGDLVPALIEDADEYGLWTQASPRG